MNGLAKLYHWCQNIMQKGYNGGEINLFMFLTMLPYFLTFFLIYISPLVKSA